MSLTVRRVNKVTRELFETKQNVEKETQSELRRISSQILIQWMSEIRDENLIREINVNVVDLFIIALEHELPELLILKELCDV
ncbi:CLUMA_CG017736, isoform A [Clunio marinus]|uniref:CLUMA_CG017736, isoform A n=1 Tax=Clunio marinus TaxID=568069 RepID=A0A1J1IX42_9DIPT|nr:CLUMA_CG017736, isoform A [Clunio marinus]